MISTSYKHPPVDLTLPAGEIHIWFAALDQPASELHRFVQTLSIDENMRTGRFRFQEDRKRFIARHGMLRMFLGCYLGVEASEIQFYHGKNGKPAVTEIFGKGIIKFSLSHSDGVALFAFARNNEIGVDIERIRDFSEVEQIVEQFFSAREKSFYQTLPQEKKIAAFINCWARKEAFVKATGEGLSCSLDKIDVTPVPGERYSLLTTEGDQSGEPDWLIHTLKLAGGYAGAFAINRKSFTLRSFEWMPLVAH